MAEKTVSGSTDQVNRTPATREEARYLTPPVDIYETGEELVVVADLPGVEKSQLDIRVADGVLTIQAQPSHEMPGFPVHEEFELASFYRQFRLAELIDQNAIKAELKNGVLWLRLPKAEEVKPKQIAVAIE